MKPPYTTLAPSKLAMHKYKDSRATFKPKPKIRIIHIVEPQIITTDVENFRELVQKLTGKPASEKKGIEKQRRKMESSMLQTAHDIIKKESEEEILYHEMENPNYLLSFLGEIDGFINDLNEFPILPFTFSSSGFNSTMGEMPLC